MPALSSLALARAVTAVFAAALVASVIVIGPDCVHVYIAASFEKSDLLERVATDYNATNPGIDFRCTRVHVYRKASGEAEQALARGWQRADGEPPHVWTPAALSWITLLERHRADAGKANILPAARPSIMRSPLVIAMPEDMARAVGWPSKDITWADLFALAQDARGWARYGHPEWGPFKLAKTSPTISTSGLHALLATYEAAFEAVGTRDIDDARVRAFVRAVEAAVVHYGDTVSTFLKNLADADDRHEVFDYVSAIAMEEKQVWDYNNGNPEFRATHTRLVPAIKLVALYPSEGTFVADHPYVVLNESWVDDGERRAAAQFLDFLVSDAIQQRFQQEGFRGHRGDPGPIVGTQPEFDPKKPVRAFSLPQPALLPQAQASWKELRKRARVAIVMDVSSSMGSGALASASKLDLAKQAALASLSFFADDDEVALWTFANSPPREVVALAPIGGQRAVLRQEIEQLTAQGPRKALLTAVTRAVESLSRRFDAARINAVLLLTDGRNDDPENGDVNGLIRLLRGQPRDQSVRVFTIGYGSAADLTTLDQMALASHGGSYEAKDPSIIDRVFQNIVSNF